MSNVAVYRGDTKPVVRRDPIGQANDNINFIFRNIWNVLRLGVFLVAFGLAVTIILNSLAAVPPGGSLTMSIILHQTYTTLSDFNAKIPVVRTVIDWIGDLVSMKEINFLIFLSSFIATLTILSCLCR